LRLRGLTAIPTSDVRTSDVWTSDVWTSDVWTSDVWTSDVRTSDVWTTDLWTTDLWTTDVLDYRRSLLEEELSFRGSQRRPPQPRTEPHVVISHYTRPNRPKASANPHFQSALKIKRSSPSPIALSYRTLRAPLSDHPSPIPLSDHLLQPPFHNGSSGLRTPFAPRRRTCV
jgi:hypothetical protein